MSLVSGALVFFLSWWMSLFMVLPWGRRKPQENEFKPYHAPGAPENPQLKKKFIITTVLAGAISLVIYMLIEVELINFYDVSHEMIERDEIK